MTGLCTVLAHGCFDVLHLGHIRHLEAAKAMGDYLVVSITADDHVGKGAGRPQFSVEQRREQLMALKCVDKVVVSSAPDAVASIEQVRPVIYVKGVDYEGKADPVLDAEVAAVCALGGEFRTTSTDKWSSTDLLRSLRLTDEAAAYVDRAKSRGFRDAILRGLEQVDQQEVNFVGEKINDIYCYVRALAKPPKEHILATVRTAEESFPGGVSAANRHCEWKKCRAITAPMSIAKKRYVDADYNRKLFEVYSSIKLDILDEQRAIFQNELRSADGFFVVTDFGHGLIDRDALKILSNKTHVAATAQTNAGNFGFNSIERYRSVASYVCVDQPEARFAMGMKDEPLEDVVKEISYIARAVLATVTSGPHGAVSYNTMTEPVRVPSLAQGGKDTMGAGDAFLAVAGPLVLAGLPVEVATFAGNIAGALKVNIIGHRSHVTREDFVRHLDWLLA